MTANSTQTPYYPSKYCLSAIVSVVVMMFVGANAARQEIQPDKEAPTFLEVRITSPPRWQKGCLLVTLDRINHSLVPLFLTEMGPYFDIALDVTTDEADATEAVEWVNIYGISDMVSSEAVALPPGATVHNKFCFEPSVWVVNLKKQTRRHIPVRGKLRVSVSYFPTGEALKRHKEWYIHPPAYLEPGKPNEMPADIKPKWARIYAAIPCSYATCEEACVRPPTGLHGESRLVPDVGFVSPDWNARGQLVTDELARKFPPCSEDKSILR